MSRFLQIETSNYQNSPTLCQIHEARTAVESGRCEDWQVESALEDLEMTLQHSSDEAEIFGFEQAVLAAWQNRQDMLDLFSQTFTRQEP